MGNLTVVDNAWHVLSMGALFVVGLYIAHAQRSVFRVRTDLAIILFLYHTIFCGVYLAVSFTDTADATEYYFRSFERDVPYNFGTYAVIHLTAVFRKLLGLSYGGLFMLFNLFGYIGLIALTSAVQSVTRQAPPKVAGLALMILFLPGISYWSAALGKDSLAFLAVGLACWGSMNLTKRFPSMLLAILIMALVRPHIAAMMLTAIAAAVIVSRDGAPWKRAAILLVSLPASYFVIRLTLEYIGLGEATDAATLSSYVDGRQDANLEGGLGLNIRDMPIVMRLFSYLYRPSFFDGGGFFGLIVSLENLVLLALSAMCIVGLFQGRRSTMPRTSLLFALLFSAAAWILLANVTANLGLAMRQKWMFVPMLILVTVSVLSGRRSASKDRRPQRRPGSLRSMPRTDFPQT